MKIESFIKKWENKTIEDDGAYMSEEFKKMFSDLKRTIKDLCKEHDAVLLSFRPSHYDGSGFIQKGARFAYISFGQESLRYKVSVNKKTWAGPILAREARNSKDYTGGRNNFCTLTELGNMLDRLLAA